VRDRVCVRERNRESNRKREIVASYLVRLELCGEGAECVCVWVKKERTRGGGGGRCLHRLCTHTRSLSLPHTYIQSHINLYYLKCTWRVRSFLSPPPAHTQTLLLIRGCVRSCALSPALGLSPSPFLLFARPLLFSLYLPFLSSLSLSRPLVVSPFFWCSFPGFILLLPRSLLVALSRSLSLPIALSFSPPTPPHYLWLLLADSLSQLSVLRGQCWLQWIHRMTVNISRFISLEVALAASIKKHKTAATSFSKRRAATSSSQFSMFAHKTACIFRTNDLRFVCATLYVLMTVCVCVCVCLFVCVFVCAVCFCVRVYIAGLPTTYLKIGGCYVCTFWNFQCRFCHLQQIRCINMCSSLSLLLLLLNVCSSAACYAFAVSEAFRRQRKPVWWGKGYNSSR